MLGRARLVLLALAGALAWGPTPAPALDLQVDAPPALAVVAARVRAVDQPGLERALAGAGLAVPALVRVTLVPEGDPWARRVPPWVVGIALPPADVVVFPDRVIAYPYDSLESVVRHEIAHLALDAAAGGSGVPRWFHEGVATSVETGWGVTSQFRLALAAIDRPAVADVTRLFSTGARPDSERAYLLATALVDDLRRRHGANAPGEIAARIAQGASFERAFLEVAGETVEVATDRAWSGYRRWAVLLPIVTGPSAAWVFIMVLAAIAFAARMRQRARRRALWGEDDEPADLDWRPERTDDAGEAGDETVH